MSTDANELLENSNIKTSNFYIDNIIIELEKFSTTLSNLSYITPKINTTISNKNDEFELMLSKVKMMNIDLNREFDNMLPDELNIHKNNIGPITPVYSVIGNLPS